MYKHRVIAVLICVLAVALTLGWKYCPRTVPVEECSQLYRDYADNPHIAAAYIRDFRVNDSLTLNVTVLEALDSAGWDTLVYRHFFVPPFEQEKQLFLNDQEETARIAPKKDISLPTDPTCTENDFLILSHTKKALYVFHIENNDQMTTILKVRLKAIKIKKQLNLNL